MQYTVTPLSYLGGVYAGMVICTILVLFMLWAFFFWDWRDAYDRTMKIACMVFVGFLLFISGILTHDGHNSHNKLLNERVVGRLVGHQEALQTRRVGKAGTETVSVLYVFYEVDGGVVSFRRGSGIIYPKEAVFYRNPK